MNPPSEQLVRADDGVRLWTWRAGHGPPVVLCHGGPGLWDELEPVAAMLTDIATVIRWDQRGAGRSDPVGPYAVARFVADPEAIRRHVGVDRWIIAGHSWGESLALRYGVAHPDRTRALICISGTDLDWATHRVTYHERRLTRLGPHRRRWQELRALENRTPAEERELNLLSWSTDFAGRRHALELAARWASDRFPINHECNAAPVREIKEEDLERFVAQCRPLGFPALIAHGEDDPRPITGPTELDRTLPDGRLEVLKGVGHLPWAEHPHLLKDVLRKFVLGLTDG